MSLLLALAVWFEPGIASEQKSFIHKQEGFRLNEQHKSNGCLTCHPKDNKNQRQNQRRGKKRDCGSCHELRHDLPRELTCKSCHTLESFSQIKPYRHLLNDFFRVGVHKTLSCRQCHPDIRFKGNPRQCVNCHMERRQDAPHGMKLGGDCEQCHTPYGWQPVRFQHPNFSLKAGHRSLNCLDCHPGYEFKNVQSYCYSCHKGEFHGGSGFDHAAAGLPYDCLLCHDLNLFAPPVSYREHPAGIISLGNHKSADCRDCHGQDFSRKLSDDECQTCHQDDYAKTKNPNHLSNGFPLDCLLCHKPTDSSWKNGGRNHTWPLRGTHKTLPCSECHQDGVYLGKSTECPTCHQTDYEGAQNPDHQASGYPLACNQCHQDSHTSWSQATFNHPLPLSGAHAGLGCTACHTEAANYTVFTCTDCHQRQNINPIHRGVPGYNYNSQSCYNCHPRGQA